MIINDNGSITYAPNELVIFSGTSQNGRFAGQPYTAVRPDRRLGFLRSQAQVDTLVKAGVRVISAPAQNANTVATPTAPRVA